MRKHALGAVIRMRLQILNGYRSTEAMSLKGKLKRKLGSKAAHDVSLHE